MSIASNPAAPRPSGDDNGQGLYADSPTIHPRRVQGRFRNLKWWAMGILLAVFHFASFLRWDRGAGAPDQAILVDLDGGRGYFFFIEIWPQEVYYLTGLLLIAAIALFLMSALAGRVWCGFLCWQTVYTDLFVAIEHLVIGDRNKRIMLDRKPWAGERLIKRGIVHAVWLVIALACGIAFTLYFGDAFQQLEDILTLNAGLGTYSAVAIVGGCCYLLAGFSREQVCLWMCPYSRFQSAMFDEHSLIVSYEAWRGEPRGRAKKGQQEFADRGHCVDCKMCVVACPTGIDIRDGSQMACIGCGLCIDACNTIMDKFGLPRGLIRYDSSHNQEAREKGGQTILKLARPRTIIYTAIMALVGGIMLYSLINRTTTEVNVLHERSPLYVQLSDGGIRNGYTFKVLNMIRQDRTYTLEIAGIEGAVMDVVGGDEKVTKTELAVKGDDVGTFRLYVSAPEDSLKGHKNDLTFILTETSEGRVRRYTSVFAAPEK